MHMKTENKADQPERILVWDRLVRYGHWATVLSFVTAYVKPRWEGHIWVGYVILAYVAVRLLWGFVGTPYARFKAFLYSPRETTEYILSALRMGKAREYLSHNPMGALMVFVLLSLLSLQACSGVMLLGAQDFSGPLAGIVPTSWEDWLEPLHETLGPLIGSCVLLHITGVAWATWWHRENYLWSMITGYKSAYKRRNHREPHH